MMPPPCAAFIPPKPIPEPPEPVAPGPRPELDEPPQAASSPNIHKELKKEIPLSARIDTPSMGWSPKPRRSSGKVKLANRSAYTGDPLAATVNFAVLNK